MGKAARARWARRERMRLKAAEIILGDGVTVVPAFDELDPSAIDGLSGKERATLRRVYEDLRQKSLNGSKIIISSTELANGVVARGVVVKRPPTDSLPEINLVFDLLIPYREHATLHCEFDELVPTWIGRHGERMGRVVAYLQCAYTIISVNWAVLRAVVSGLLR